MYFIHTHLYNFFYTYQQNQYQKLSLKFYQNNSVRCDSEGGYKQY